MGRFRIFLYFFCIFGARPRVGDFVIFSYFFRISGLEGFLSSRPGTRDHNIRRLAEMHPKTQVTLRPCLPALTLQSLLFSISLLFCFPIFLAFLGIFPFFSKELRGAAERKTLFFGGFPCFFSKEARVGGSGQSIGVAKVIHHSESLRFWVLHFRVRFGTQH